MKPAFICIGFQKCGTTSLYDILRQHKKIYLTEGVKEPMFYRVPLLRLCLGKNWYEKRYFGRFCPEEGQTAGEINAGLTFQGCAAKVGRDFPAETRLIFLMRNPADRCYSAYKYFLPLGFLPYKTVLDDQKRGHAAAFDKYVHHVLDSPVRSRQIMRRRLKYLCFSQGNYARCIEEYLQYFPKENMKFVFFEEMVQNQQKTVEDILEFIHVEKNSGINYNIKSNESIFCAVSPLRSKIIYFSQGIYHLFMDFLHLGRFPAAARTFRKLFRHILAFCIAPETDKSKMFPRTRQFLNQYYKEEIARLEELIGRKVPESWGRAA